MKRILIVIIVLLFTSIIIQSCEKDEIKEIAKTDSTKVDNNIKSGDTLETSILDFIEKMDLIREESDYPGSEEWNYNQEDAVWFIEAALNYTHAGEWMYTGGKDHSEIYNVNESNTVLKESSVVGEFNIIALQLAYDKLAAELLTQYNSISGDKKFFIVSDIIDNGMDGSQLQLGQTAVFGEPIDALSYNDWYWGFNMGKCDGSEAPKDATDVIEWKNSQTAVNPSPVGYSHYYVDVAEIPVNLSDVPTTSNPFGFLQYELYAGPNNTCMNTTMINYYYNYFKTFDTRFTPTGFVHIFSDLQSGSIPSGYDGYHYTDLKYGSIHFTSNFVDPPIE